MAREKKGMHNTKAMTNRNLLPSAPIKSLWSEIPLSVRLVLGVLLLLLLTALFAPQIAPYGPEEIDLSIRLAPVSAQHLLGTDHLGRDVLSRLIWGSRISLGSVLLTALFILATGFVTGAAAGWFGGWIDNAIMRLCEVFMTFPTFILAMFLIGILGRGLANVIIAIVLTHWAWYARIVRSMVAGMKNREYILAARISGGSELSVFFRHVALPVFSQIVILITLDLGHMMLHVSGLSFLGLGIQPPMPEWGVMISDARAQIWSDPHLAFIPGLVILLTVLAFNIPGEWLRDRLDPAIRKKFDA